MDSDSDDEGFDGFSSEYLQNSDEGTTQHSGFDDTEWTAGYPLNFTATPGIIPQMPENPSPLDFINMFTKRTMKPVPPRQTYMLGKTLTAMTYHCIVGLQNGERHLLKSNFILGGDCHGACESVRCIAMTPFFPEGVSRDRFRILTSFFHLCDNTTYIPHGRGGYDPKRKLGDVYINMVSRFASSYKPHRQLSTDEGMIPWRGNLGFRVYAPDKPTKYRQMSQGIHVV